MEHLALLGATATERIGPTLDGPPFYNETNMTRPQRYEVRKNANGFLVVDTITGEIKLHGLATSELAIARRNELEKRMERTRRGER